MSGSVDAVVAPDRAATRGTTVVRESRWLAGSGVVVGLVNYGYSLLLTQLLAPGAFADFAAAQSLLLVCGTLATSSMPWVVARVLSEPGASEHARHQAIWFSVVVNLLQGVLAAGVMCLIGSRFLSPASLAAVAVGTVAIFLTTTPGGWLQGIRRFDRLAFFRVLEVVVKLAVGVALVLAGTRDTGALVGVAAGALVVVTAGLVLMRSDLHRAPGALRVRSLWTASLGNVGVQGLVAVLASTDVVLVAVLDGGSADSGSYQAAAILGRVPMFLAGALGAAAFPALVASARAAGDVRGTTVSSYSWLAGVYALALVTAPAVLVSLVFPSSYALVDDVLPWAALSGLLAGLVNLLTTFFQAAAQYRPATRLLAVAVPAHLAVLLVGWASADVQGIAVASPLVPLLVVVALLRTPTARIPRPHPPAAGVTSVAVVAAAAALVVSRPFAVVWVSVAVVVGVAALRLGLRQRPRAGSHRRRTHD